MLGEIASRETAMRRSSPPTPARKPVAHRLDLLREELEALFASQQTPAAAARMKRAFASTPKRMGRVAAAAARKPR